jgi:hypothetical protein
MPEGVHVVAYKKNETGDYESVGLVNVWHHIGCPTNQGQKELINVQLELGC